MSDLPKSVHINEEGPREGFQIEKGHIATARKIELIDALAKTGLDHIQIVSFVNPKAVPGMADAEDVVHGVTPQPGVAYTGLWLNEKGFERAVAVGRLELTGVIQLAASPTFLKRNQNRTPEAQLQAQHNLVEHVQGERHRDRARQPDGGVRLQFRGRHSGRARRRSCRTNPRRGARTRRDAEICHRSPTPWPGRRRASIKRVLGAIKNRFPDVDIALHLHDTRGMGIANAFAGMEMGVTRFDSSVAGLGGCPFAGHAGAAGNVCTEDLVFMCNEMGIETGIDLDALIECARLAEDVVGHPLPGSVMKGGSLRQAAREATGSVVSFAPHPEERPKADVSKECARRHGSRRTLRVLLTMRQVNRALLQYLPDPARRRHDALADIHRRTHECHRTRRAHGFRLRLDEIAEVHGADELDVELDGGMPLVAGRAPSGQRHDLIGERHQHAAMHVAGAVEVLALDHEAETKVRRRPPASRTDRPCLEIPTFPVSPSRSAAGSKAALWPAVETLSFMQNPR